MRSYLSARGERSSACGAGPPHAEMGVVRELHLSASIVTGVKMQSNGHGTFGDWSNGQEVWPRFTHAQLVDGQLVKGKNSPQSRPVLNCQNC